MGGGAAAWRQEAAGLVVPTVVPTVQAMCCCCSECRSLGAEVGYQQAVAESALALRHILASCVLCVRTWISSAFVW
jgi:hypothetical protein